MPQKDRLIAWMDSEKDPELRRQKLETELDRRIIAFAHTLRTMRNVAKITLKEIEAATGLTAGNLSYIESGKKASGMTLKNVLKIAFALGIQPSELVRMLDAGPRADADLTFGGLVPVAVHSSVRPESRENITRELEAISARGSKPRSNGRGVSAPRARSKKHR